jgi:DNA-binding NarL/FixJ family response regulator
MTSTSVVPINKVYLLAEHRLLRETVLRLLQKKSEIQVVGVGRCTDSTAQQILDSECEILLLDSLTTPDSTGLLEELLTISPDLKIVLFGMDEDGDEFIGAVRIGISGYVLKDASAAEIVTAVRTVAQGHAACPPSLCKVLFRALSRNSEPEARITSREAKAEFGLTTRQSQLVALVARGMTNKEIAATLNLSEFTVKNHLHRIMRQIKATDRHSAVDLIRANGFLPSA